jgi:type IV secretion system protein VirB4
VFFPNHQAQSTDYVDGFGLSGREFAWVREDLLPGSRQFLVRQGGEAVVCEWNLNGLDDLLAVLAGRGADVTLAQRIRAAVGDDPAAWLSAFHAARAQRAADALPAAVSGTDTSIPPTTTR